MPLVLSDAGLAMLPPAQLTLLVMLPVPWVVVSVAL
jgi:hypothetical protein